MRVMSKFVFIMLSFYTFMLVGGGLFVYLFVVVEGFFLGGGVTLCINFILPCVLDFIATIFLVLL